MNGLGDRAKEVAIEHVKHKAARDILNGIKDWRSDKIFTAKRRWVFEILQNAIDTAKARQKENLKIEIHTNEDSISFKHDGGYFTLDEISAVIYGGSTKPYAPESEYIGKFGTGFLVTHIVSRRVKISGVIKGEEGNIYKFEMVVNRESNEEEGISRSIEECFQQLNASQRLDTREQDLYTEFVFYLNDDIGKNALRMGIDELKRNLPFIFAFNDTIQEITINGEKFTKQNENVEHNNGITVTNVSSSLSVLPKVFIKKANDGQIVVGICVDGSEIMVSEELPKIYVGMPLIETADYINIPFVVNCALFEPTKERNALSSSREKSGSLPAEYEINKELLSQAFELYKELLEEVSKLGNIKRLYRTINIQLVSDEKISQNPLWKDFNDYTIRTFKQIIEEIQLVETFEGKKEVKNTIFPTKNIKGYSLGDALFQKFYQLTAQIKKNVPAVQEELNDWVNTVEGLKKIGDFSRYISLFGVENMKKELEDFIEQRREFPNFININERFCIEDSKQFLLSFFEIVEDLYKREIISSEFVDYLLPAQSDRIGARNRKLSDNKRFTLSIDNNIPANIKDIFHKIGWRIREELLHNDFAEYEVIKDFVNSELNTDEALDRLIKDDGFKPNIEMLKREEWNDNILGWIELFRWCIVNNKLKIGFPVVTKEKEIRSIDRLDDVSLVIPFKYINISENYEDIFPESRIMHDKYFEIEDPEKFIENLENYKAFVTKLPLYKSKIKIGYNKLNSILMDENEIPKVDHIIDSQDDEISFLPFLEQEIEGRVSQVQERGKLLFKFVSEYLIYRDNSWDKSLQVKCDCQNEGHTIIPSQWLASLKSDAWVPYKTIEKEGEKIVKREATKESIENLLSEKLNKLIPEDSDKFTKFTKFLTHFGFDELDLTIKFQSKKTGIPEKDIRKGISILSSVMPDISVIIQKDPNLFNLFKEKISELRDRYEKLNLKDENRIIGENVEKIIRKIISDRGLEVQPIYAGGDLEIWPEDREGWDSGLIQMKSYYIEVKFTSGSRVHLSKIQSEMARDKKEYYVVLVVENTENLRESLKNIDENSISNEIISAVEKNSKVIETIYNKLGNIPNPEEVEPDINGYWIKKKLWSLKNDIVKWIEHRFG